MVNQTPGAESITNGSGQIILGWREWVALPDLQLPALKAKIDSGAKTSALHAFQIDAYTRKGIDMVRFLIHPIQRNRVFQVECHARIKDYREVTDSGGHREMRYVIETTLTVGDADWMIEMTLTNRDTMRFRMLLGRRAMEGRILVDSGASFLMGRLKPHRLYGLQVNK